jgi:hypothetical protein
MKIQIRTSIFKPNGKFYTEDWPVVEADLINRNDAALVLDHVATCERVKEYYGKQYKNMIILCQHELMTPFLIMPEQ